LSLFARTFLLLGLLMLASLLTWLHVFWTLEQAHRAQQMANQIVRHVQTVQTIQSLTPASLRQIVLAQFVTQTQLRLQTEPAPPLHRLPQTPDWLAVAALIDEQLGPDVARATSSTNAEDLWLQLPDGQWLSMQMAKPTPGGASQWISWLAATTLLSMLGAAMAVGYLHWPLTRLARAAKQLSQDQTPRPLPETGPPEISALNASFNHMVTELRELQAQRDLMLAGLSHDLRTPLTRLRLEVQMSPMGQAQQQAIEQDLSQMNRIIGQLVRYAKPATPPPCQPIDLAGLLGALINQMQQRLINTQDQIVLAQRTPDSCFMDADDLRRCLINLIENAQRYGRSTDGVARIGVIVEAHETRLWIDVHDQGCGIAACERARLMQPFARGQSARSGSDSAGLGLAIVQRLLAPAAGHLHLLSSANGGLTARIDLPRVALSSAR
jgi:two-component system osmolarity sensor histidine kinase EnvZ